MFYSYKNIPISLNGTEVLAQNVSVSQNTSLQPVYDIGNIINKNYKATDGIIGSLNLSYFPTGIDLIKSCINRTYTLLSGNIGGFYFNSGYLTNFKLNTVPNSPVSADCEIVFFENLKGTLNPSIPTKVSRNFLNISDVSISTAGSSESLGNINSLSYNYSVNIKPVYYIGTQTGISSVSPNRVSIGEKNLSIGITTDSINQNLSFTGNSSAGITLGFSSPSLIGIVDYLHCSGIIETKSFTVNNGENAKTNILIKENNIYDIPRINSFSPSSVLWSGDISIFGENLDIYPLAGITVGNILSNKNSIENIQVINSSQIAGRVPGEVLNDNLTAWFIIGDNKIISTQSTEQIAINYPDISVSTINPSSYSRNLESGKNILLTGDNFYFINKVLFSGIEADFDVISPNSLRVNLPNYAITSKINVVSEQMGKSGLSPTFSMPSYISGISPSTGFSGTLYSISGRNFLNAVSVYIGYRSGIFEVVNDNLITGMVPSGNTYGPISVTLPVSPRQTNSRINYFTPIMRITGVSPGSGKYLERVTVTTSEILDPELLLRTGIQPNEYAVYFGGMATGFIRTGPKQLTGLVPSGFVSGKVALAVPSGGGVTYLSNANYLAIFDPQITSVRINSPRSGQLISGKTIGQNKTCRMEIQGANFYTVTGLLFSGNQEYPNYQSPVDPSYNNHNSYFLVTSANLINQNNSYITIEDYRLTGARLNNGMYDVYVLSSGAQSLFTGVAYVNDPLNLCIQPYSRSSGSSYYSKNGFTFDSRIARNNVTGGNSGNYGVYLSETTHGSGAWWEVDFGYEVPEINKVDFYHSSNIDERVALFNYIFLFYNKNRSQLHAPEFYTGPNDSLYPVYSGIYLSGNVPCRYVRVQQAVDHSQLEIAELKVY